MSDLDTNPLDITPHSIYGQILACLDFLVAMFLSQLQYTADLDIPTTSIYRQLRYTANFDIPPTSICRHPHHQLRYTAEIYHVRDMAVYRALTVFYTMLRYFHTSSHRNRPHIPSEFLLIPPPPPIQTSAGEVCAAKDTIHTTSIHGRVWESWLSGLSEDGCAEVTGVVVYVDEELEWWLYNPAVAAGRL